MKVKIEKLEEFRAKLREINRSADGKNSAEMALADRMKGIKIASEYYTYLEASGELYGKAALLVINDQGLFGKTANIHLRTQAVFDGVSKAYLPELQDRIKINLAFADITQRLKLQEKFDYTTISNYHIDVFKAQGISEYAWGGLAIEELLGPGKWMSMVDSDVKKFDQTLEQLSKIKRGESQYALDRLVTSAKHSLSCYTTFERDYAPIIRTGTPEQAAKGYGVPLSRVVKYTDESLQADSSMVRSYVYKILPNDSKNALGMVVGTSKEELGRIPGVMEEQVKGGAQPPTTKKSVVFLPQESIKEQIARHTGQAPNLIDDVNKRSKEQNSLLFGPVSEYERPAATLDNFV